MLARDGRIERYVPLPKGQDFREYAWLTGKEVKAYYHTDYATDTILARNLGTRKVLHWDHGEELEQFLILVRVLPGIPVMVQPCATRRERWSSTWRPAAASGAC